MRIKSRFAFWATPEEAAEYYSLVNQTPRNLPKEKKIIALEIFQDQPEHDLLSKTLAERGINPIMSEDEVFTETEMLQAPIMQMVPNSHYGGYPQPEEGYLEASFSKETGCPYCSMGWLQVKPLRLKSSTKMGKRSDISGIWWLREYIITKRAKEIIEANELTGCEIWPVIKHGKNVPFEDIFQLKITGELPPMAPQTPLHVEPIEWRGCKNGHGWTSIKGRIHYRASDLIDVPDFAWTHEWLNGRYELWRWPFMSQKAYRIFKENKINGARFYPPAIIDE